MWVNICDEPTVTHTAATLLHDTVYREPWPHLSQFLDGPIQVHIGVLVDLMQEAAQLLQRWLHNLRVVTL